MKSDPTLSWQPYICIIRKGKGFFKQKNGACERLEYFKNIFGLIDDLCTFSNKESENNYKFTYLDELELQKENKDPYKTYFLDLSIEVHDRKLPMSYFIKETLFFFISIECRI